MKRTLALLALVLLAGCTAQSTPSPTAGKLPAKAALVAEYEPGTCYGMPGGVSQEMVASALQQNADVAAFVRDRYNLTEDRAVFNRVKQFNAVTLTETSGGYEFTVEDGNCCTITTYTGTVTKEDGRYTISQTGNTTENVPC
ncbi:MAG: hypothetical protein SVW02_02775 [Candidatus Nanohaloarchaea archaeon]|nr:hypothetical protein [Candidatus Nanohaloarchaea archaeon]